MEMVKVTLSASGIRVFVNLDNVNYMRVNEGVYGKYTEIRFTNGDTADVIETPEVLIERAKE